MQKKQLPISAIFFLTAGELAVSLVIVGVYFLLKKFSYEVVTGALLGSAVTVFNFVFLSISVNRAIDRVMAEKGNRDMTEEEAQAFAAEHQAVVQRAAQGSYLIRQIIMLAALVLAFLSGWFDVLATLIPLLMFRPLISIYGLLKKDKKGA